MTNPLAYPINSTSQVTAHFTHLKPEPPAHLAAEWHALVLRRMTGQDVDAECAALLQRERDYNASLIPVRQFAQDKRKSRVSRFV